MKYGVYIGRFQPFHFGHLYLIEDALKRYDRLIVMIGSAQESRTARNPFNFAERAAMIGQSLKPEHLERVWITSLFDVPQSNESWAMDVVTRVNKVIWSEPAKNAPDFAPVDIVTFLGTDKDAGKGGLTTSGAFYEQYFPRFKHEVLAPFFDVNATDVRKAYFAKGVDAIAGQVPEGVLSFLNKFRNTDPWYLTQRYGNVAA